MLSINSVGLSNVLDSSRIFYSHNKVNIIWNHLFLFKFRVFKFGDEVASKYSWIPGSSPDLLVFPRYHHRTASITHHFSILVHFLWVACYSWPLSLAIVPALVQTSSLDWGVVELLRFYGKQGNYVMRNLEKLIGYSIYLLVCNILPPNLVAFNNNNNFILSHGFCTWEFGKPQRDSASPASVTWLQLNNQWKGG